MPAITPAIEDAILNDTAGGKPKGGKNTNFFNIML